MHLPSDLHERRALLAEKVQQYEANGIYDTVYHRWLAETQVAIESAEADSAAQEEDELEEFDFPQEGHEGAEAE